MLIQPDPVRRPFRILNLYACLGGNRYKWTDCNVTAVELDVQLARMYQDRFPDDEVVIGDAHQYLIENYRKFDFIWSSPPCPSHSRIRISQKNRENFVAVYPDLKLYEEIIFLENYYEGKYCVENVIPFYEPLIPAKKRGRHLYWTNFNLPSNLGERKEGVGLVCAHVKDEVKKLCEFHDYDFTKYVGDQRIDKIARNLVDYEVGRNILNIARGIIESSNIKQTKLFDQTVPT